MPVVRPPVKPIVGLAKRVLPVVSAICPNPNVSVSLPPKITFGCR